METQKRKTEDLQIELLPDKPIPEPEVGVVSLEFIESVVGAELPDKGFRESWKRLGQQEEIWLGMPLEGEPTPDNPYVIHAGKRRVMTARYWEQTEIKAKIYPAWVTSSHIRHLLTLTENHQRKPNKIASWLAIKGLWNDALAEKGQITEEDIAHAVGISVAEVKSLLKLQGLILELQQALIDGRIKVSAAQEAATRLSHDNQKLLYQKLSQPTFTVKQGMLAALTVSGVLETDEVAKLRPLLNEKVSGEEAFLNSVQKCLEADEAWMKEHSKEIIAAADQKPGKIRMHDVVTLKKGQHQKFFSSMPLNLFANDRYSFSLALKASSASFRSVISLISSTIPIISPLGLQRGAAVRMQNILVPS